jgi:hypothetical protein
MREEVANRLQMRARHHKNERRLAGEPLRERLAALLGNIEPELFQSAHGMRAGGLAGNRADAGGGDPDFVVALRQFPEKALRHRTAADVPGANKKDKFW